MSVTDELLANNARYAESFQGPLSPPPQHVAVVARMDARLKKSVQDDAGMRGFVFDVATGQLTEVVR